MAVGSASIDNLRARGSDATQRGGGGGGGSSPGNQPSVPPVPVSVRSPGALPKAHGASSAPPTHDTHAHGDRSMGGALTDVVQACCVKVTDFCDERMPDPPRAGNPAVGKPTVDARAMKSLSSKMHRRAVGVFEAATMHLSRGVGRCVCACVLA